MSAKHTPGSWTVYKSPDGVDQTVIENGATDICYLAHTEIAADGYPAASPATAALISAAPDLLAACEAAASLLDAIGRSEMPGGYTMLPSTLASCLEAITKARGGA